MSKATSDDEALRFCCYCFRKFNTPAEARKHEAEECPETTIVREIALKLIGGSFEFMIEDKRWANRWFNEDTRDLLDTIRSRAQDVYWVQTLDQSKTEEYKEKLLHKAFSEYMNLLAHCNSCLKRLSQLSNETAVLRDAKPVEDNATTKSMGETCPTSEGPKNANTGL